MVMCVITSVAISSVIVYLTKKPLSGLVYFVAFGLGAAFGFDGVFVAAGFFLTGAFLATGFCSATGGVGLSG
jgi:hypothetical protein